MADTSNGASRSIADEIGENVFESIKTPAEIFFFALFVIGILSLAATTLVGPCGNVDDIGPAPDPRVVDYVPGATVFVTSSILLGETVIAPGACGIIDSVDEEAETARVHILAKAEPFFAEGEGPYRASAVLSGLAQSPIATLYFLHIGSPIGDMPFHQITPVATKGYTNWFRHFYLETIYFLMILLAVVVLVLVYIGRRFVKKRELWYEWHTLRATYISRLMQDKERMKSLQEDWEKVPPLSESDSPEQWKEALDLLESTLDGVLVQLRFEGDSLTDKLQNMKEDDLWMLDRLWKAHSLVVLLREGSKEEGGEVPPMTKETVGKVVKIYKEAFIWLGLLPHWA